MSSEFVDQERSFMAIKQNILGDTIPGTTKYHRFQPANHIRIDMFSFQMVSEDTDLRTHNFFTRKTHAPLPQAEASPQCYIGCVYDDEWWVGMVRKLMGINSKLNSCTKKDLIPNKGFYWPTRDVCCIDMRHSFGLVHSRTLIHVSYIFFSKKS